MNKFNKTYQSIIKQTIEINNIFNSQQYQIFFKQLNNSQKDIKERILNYLTFYYYAVLNSNKGNKTLNFTINPLECGEIYCYPKTINQSPLMLRIGDIKICEKGENDLNIYSTNILVLKTYYNKQNCGFGIIPIESFNKLKLIDKINIPNLTHRIEQINEFINFNLKTTNKPLTQDINTNNIFNQLEYEQFYRFIENNENEIIKYGIDSISNGYLIFDNKITSIEENTYDISNAGLLFQNQNNQQLYIGTIILSFNKSYKMKRHIFIERELNYQQSYAKNYGIEQYHLTYKFTSSFLKNKKEIDKLQLNQNELNNIFTNIKKSIDSIFIKN